MNIFYNKGNTTVQWNLLIELRIYIICKKKKAKQKQQKTIHIKETRLRKYFYLNINLIKFVKIIFVIQWFNDV